MNLKKHFILSSYAMFATGFVMLASTRQLDPVSLVLFAGALVAGWMIDTGSLRWGITPRRANLLMVGYPSFAFAEWQLFGMSPVVVIIHFVFFASALKLLKQKTDRDWLWLYVVTFCQVLMTAGLIIDATFLFLLVVYLFTAVSTLISYEIRRAARSFEKSGVSPPVSVEYWKETRQLRRRLDPPRLRSLAVFSGFALMFILLLAAPLFLAMPRVSKGMSRNGLLPTEMLSGFSESVRLGEVAQIKLNPQVVMRVRVRFSPGEKRRSLRWRGVTLDYYDGQSWNYTGPKPVAMKKIGDSFHLNDTVWAQSYTEQRFFVEPLNISTVFAAPNPFLVAGLPELGRDRGDGLWTSPHEFHTLDYTVFSTVPDPSDENLAADNSRIYPSEILRRHATSYAGFDRRITDLAAELTRDSRTQIEIVRRIENHLRNAYSYSLDLRRVEDGDPVADFLFNTREGHCEYFASAMVLMLRSRRVPARLVNGFQMGEYNKAADVYTVRQSDAHSWVEVFFPKHGWLAFDPTPSAGLSVYEEGLMAWLRQHSEALEMFWLEHVVGFDTGKQISMAITAQAWVSRLFSSYRLSDYSYGWLDWVSNLARSVELWRERGGIDGGVFDGAWPAKSPSDFVSHPLAQILFGLLLVSAAIVSWRRYDRSWRRRMGRNASAAAIAFYAEMIRTLERKGLKRAEDETPGEFSSRLRSPAVAEITGFYQRVRFGNQPLDGGEIARIGILLRELKKQTAKSLLARYRS